MTPLCACLAAALLVAGNAQAAPWQATVDFTIDVFNTPDDFVTAYGLSNGDTVSVTGLYDDSGLSNSGFEDVVFDSLSINIGSLTLLETDDDEFGAGFPKLDLLDGNFLRFQFFGFHTVNSKDYEVTLENFLEIYNPIGDLVVQNTSPISSSTVSLTPIPLPPALLLFGSALAAARLRRR